MLDYRDYPELSAEFLARHPIDDPRFEPWLEAWYGPPLTPNLWEREPEDVAHHPDKETLAVFVARSWSMGRLLTERFGVEPVGQTIFDLSFECSWPQEPEKGERMMWDAVGTLFEEVLIPHADDTLRDRNEPGTEIGSALFMFWDVCGWGSESEVGLRALLRLLERSLASPKAAVQESAVHGIGEFVNRGYPEVRPLGLAFVETGRTSRPELFEYAARAVEGDIL